MNATVEVDKNSGFCPGVIRAVEIARDKLEENEGGKIFSLGALVHNESVLGKLESKGLVAIDIDDLDEMRGVEDAQLVIRAHGEPPQTYRKAEALGFKVVDCTCPVVLRLQNRIRESYQRMKEAGSGQILIFGKVGHAEVLGLVGQTEGKAVVIESMMMLESMLDDGTISCDVPTEIFSQTTKSPQEYAKVCERLSGILGDRLTVHDTICRQVSTRHDKLSRFAMSHSVVIFVSGKSSSNGRVLCEFCKSVNIRTYNISSTADINEAWFREDDNVGVCGAASTPKELLEEIAEGIREILRKRA